MAYGRLRHTGSTGAVRKWTDIVMRYFTRRQYRFTLSLAVVGSVLVMKQCAGLTFGAPVRTILGDGVGTQRFIADLARLWRNTRDHLVLVGISLSAALVVSIPLGIVAARRRRLGQVILTVVGVIQTIPSLALFVFMIPLLGIGGPPAMMALFLYSLLPIVRNTHAGLSDIPPDIIESADAIGLPPRARLLRVELPMAGRAILAGIKTSAVINVGTATLGALIGAGGYGPPTPTRLPLRDIGRTGERVIRDAATRIRFRPLL